MNRLFLLLSLVATLMVCGCQPRYDNRPDYRDYRHERVDPFRISPSAVIDAHNQERRRSNLRWLRNDYQLQQAAQCHADWMARNQRLSHTGENWSSLKTRVGPTHFRCLGENIAYGQHTIDEVMRGWMNSSGHRRNILNRDFTHVGVGYATARNGQIYWCVVFGG